ncbi:VC2046/SO_2500 family protein [Catenovulum sp. 2E275]|uniref:VC2046/SO_2500 family protein n=1 Tax=Catenovulum sp. 2E275 TaxID=2980497 RepID=UPI0021CDF88D|nr:VC2046/SO_2500 family protein [Catenovulum sp. 2E275]MCU4674948.1 VC2046/SO_2500 family protein [Catenovulum sp. 2E275]
MHIQLNQPLNEASFDGQLNQAVNAQLRSDFAFMLACQTPNVAEHAQFQLAKNQDYQQNNDEAQLKVSLGVYTYLKLAADDAAFTSAVATSVELHQNGLAQAKLQSYLQAQALSQFNDTQKLDDQLLANLDRHTLYRLNQREENPQTEADATQLYDILNQINQA